MFQRPDILTLADRTIQETTPFLPRSENITKRIRKTKEVFHDPNESVSSADDPHLQFLTLHNILAVHGHHSSHRIRPTAKAVLNGGQEVSSWDNETFHRSKTDIDNEKLFSKGVQCSDAATLHVVSVNLRLFKLSCLPTIFLLLLSVS